MRRRSEMNNYLESPKRDLGISNGDLSSMKRLRRRATAFRMVRAILSSTVGFLAGFIPAAVLAMERSRTNSTYPYAAALTISMAIVNKDRKQSRVMRIISIPFLVLGIIVGLGVGSGMSSMTLYGVCRRDP